MVLTSKLTSGKTAGEYSSKCFRELISQYRKEMVETYELEKIIEELYKLEEMLGRTDSFIIDRSRRTVITWTSKEM